MPTVKVRIPEGTYVMCIDFSGYGISVHEVHDRIYNKANVILEDGHFFGIWVKNSKEFVSLHLDHLYKKRMKEAL